MCALWAQIFATLFGFLTEAKMRDKSDANSRQPFPRRKSKSVPEFKVTLTENGSQRMLAKRW